MKTQIKLPDFLNYANITYDDDIYTSQHVEYENFSNSDIIEQLPKMYKLTEQDLEKYPDLKENLNNLFNDANRDGIVDVCMTEQNKMVERVADEMVDYINLIQDEYGKTLKPLNNITIDWTNEIVTIDFNRKDALSTIREIINGEGTFHYATNDEFARCYDSTKNVTQTVIQHLHYLLNIKLIDSIYGLINYPNNDWDIQRWDISKETIEQRIEEFLTEMQYKFAIGKIHPNTFAAIELQKQITIAEDNLKTLRKETCLARQQIIKKEQQLYVDAIA